jgi:hypothetical protein
MIAMRVLILTLEKRVSSCEAEKGKFIHISRMLASREATQDSISKFSRAIALQAGQMTTSFTFNHEADPHCQSGKIAVRGKNARRIRQNLNLMVYRWH